MESYLAIVQPSRGHVVFFSSSFPSSTIEISNRTNNNLNGFGSFPFLVSSLTVVPHSHA